MVDTRFGLTQTEYRRLFRLLTDYAKHYNCHVTELFASDHSQYYVCFRPIGVEVKSPNWHACVYITFAVGRAVRMAREGSLAPSVIGELDEKVPALGRLT